MRPAAAVAVTVALLLGVSPALAQPSQTPPVQQPYQYVPPPGQPGPTDTHRYGTKIALVDGLSFGAMMIGVVVLVTSLTEYDNGGDDGDAALGVALMIGGAGGYLFGGPLVHSSQGNTSGAWKSFGLRLGLPLVGGLIGEAMRKQECNGDYCTESSGPGDSLSGIGVLSAMVIDWFVLAKVERPAAGYVPYATTTANGGAAFGLAGTF